MKNILFLCTGNSCRSQMAEAWAKSLLDSDIQFHSAGILKSTVNPFAAKVMDEVGLSLAQHSSKTVEELSDVTMDWVITLCSDADKTCPAFPGGKITHHPFDDPPRLTEGLDNEEERLQVYRRVRDEIKDFVSGML